MSDARRAELLCIASEVDTRRAVTPEPSESSGTPAHRFRAREGTDQRGRAPRGAKGGRKVMQFTDTASAGNGGVATASANGGAVAIGDVNSGGNAGNAIGVGDTWGGRLASTAAPSPTAPAEHLRQRRHRHRGRLRRRLQPRLRQLGRAGFARSFTGDDIRGERIPLSPNVFLCHRAVAAPHVAGLGKALLASGADEDLETYIEHARKRSLPSSAFDQEAFRALIALARSRR